MKAPFERVELFNFFVAIGRVRKTDMFVTINFDLRLRRARSICDNNVAKQDNNDESV